MLFCPECRQYTLEQKCPKCKGKTIKNKPPKFSPEDRYGKYRRITKNAGKNQEAETE